MEGDLKDNNIFNSEHSNISDILPNQDTNEELSEKLVDVFSIRLTQLEQSYKEKETDVKDLMFNLHSVIIIGDEIKTSIPDFKVKAIGNRHQIQEDMLNSSKLSTMSKRSVSSNKASVGKQFGKNSEPKDKFSKFSQNVAINICSSQSQEMNLNRSILVKNPKKDVPNTPTKVPVQNKFNVNNKSKLLKPEPVINKGPIKKSDDNMVKVDIKKSPLMHSNVNEKNTKEPVNKMPGDNKPFNRKTNSDDLTVALNPKMVNPSSKFPQSSEVQKSHVNNYHSSGNINSELFVNQINNKASTYKFEPKKLKNNLDNKSKEKLINFLGNRDNQKILNLIFKFSSFKEQSIIKNISKLTRKIYFTYLIGNLTNKVNFIQNDKIVSLELEIPKVLEHKINKENLVISKYKETLQANLSFVNIINLVYLLVNENEVKNINKSLNDKITFIEDFVVLFDSNNNLYKVLKEITTRLKKNHHIFNSLKNHSDIIKFTFTGLSSEFIPLIEYLHILNKNLTSKSNNTELLIDLEIINHKIEILKTLSNSI